MKKELCLCDRCGKELKHPLEYDYENDIAFLQLIHSNDVDEEGENVETYYDFCWDCYNELIAWMPKKKKKKT